MFYLITFLFILFLFYENALYFLINYHIYCIYICIYICIFFTNYVFFLKFGYLYLTTYVYFYWVIYINCLILNTSVLLFYLDFFYDIFIIKVLSRLNFVCLDLKNSFFDFLFYFSGFVNFLAKPNLFLEKFKILFTQVNDRRKYILKKYVYTINHKRIAINYFIFSL